MLGRHVISLCGQSSISLTIQDGSASWLTGPAQLASAGLASKPQPGQPAQLAGKSQKTQKTPKSQKPKKPKNIDVF